MTKFTTRILSGQRGHQTAHRNLIHSMGIAALIVLLVASGAGATYAFWTSSATVSTTATGATIAVTTNFDTAFTTAKYANHSLTVNGTFTVTNTTSTTRTMPMNVSSQLSASIPATYATVFDVATWRQSATYPCTLAAVPSNTASGVVQGKFSTIPAISSSVPTNSSPVVHCVRVTATDRTQLGSSAGTFAMTPKVVSTLTVNGTSAWVATAEATVTQSTQSIYPMSQLSTGSWYQVTNATSGGSAGTSCLDVEGASNSNGTRVISWGCKTSGVDNQRWSLEKDGSYYRFLTKMSGGRAMIVSDASTMAGSGIEIRWTSGDEGLWQLQRISTGVYQLVNKKSGLCLTRGTEVGIITPMSQTPCAASTAQRFVLTSAGSTGTHRPAEPTVAGPAVPAAAVSTSGTDGYYTDWKWPLASTPGQSSDFVVVIDGVVTDVPVLKWDTWALQMWATPNLKYGFSATPGSSTLEVRRGSEVGELIVSVPVRFASAPDDASTVLVYPR